MVVYLVVATVLTLQQIPQMNIFGFSIGTGLAYVQRRKMSPAPVLFSSTSPGTKVSLSLSNTALCEVHGLTLCQVLPPS